MSELQITGLHKSFGRTPVLEDLELTVPDGSLTAILGPSGSGKTTLLRVLAGLQRPDRGIITIGGRTVDGAGRHVPADRRRIGYVPQEGALFPHLTVRANVAFGLPRGRRRDGAGRLLEMVGLAELDRRYPHQLSGGQQQRVALARALAVEPEIVLLDEPFSSLDASLRGHVREEVRALLSDQGVTTVLVTHDQEEALSLADVVAVLRDGRIVQQATPAELYEQPLDERLARFLGAVNVIDAQLEPGLARTRLGALALQAAAGAPDAGARSGPRAGSVMIRPEQLDVHALGERSREEPAAVGVRGRVEQCRYYGHDALLHIRAQDGGDGQLLLARVSGAQALPAGTPVRVAAHGPVVPLAG